MRLELTGHNIEITPPLRRVVEKKLAKLDRLLSDGALSAQAVLTQEKYRRRAEITLHARGEKFLHGVGNSEAWETSVAEAIEKIEQQAHRVKGKWQARKRRGRQVAASEAPPAAAESRRPARPASTRVRPRMPPILQPVKQAVTVMTIADAARAARSGDDGVILFRQASESSISVLYRRKSGELVLVEPEE